MAREWKTWDLSHASYIKNDDEAILTKDEEISSRWRVYFQTP